MMLLKGLHHVTAITAQAAKNLEFYTQALGMRLVKKTVNQDDVSAYHLFYADAVGSPGTDLTFFDWPHTPPNRNGAGSIGQIALRVPSSSAMDWWDQRFSELGIKTLRVRSVDGEDRLNFSDPEGLALALVSDGGAPGGVPWSGGPVPAEMGIRGLHSVLLQVRAKDPTAWVLTEVLGFHLVEEHTGVDGPNRQIAIFTSGEGGPGSQVVVESGPHLLPNRQGRGGVHHVAFRTPDDDEQRAWRERILSAGLQVTPIIDRFYFKSIYFREPGGVLFEIATDGPGFAADEDLANLGSQLALPPFLEHQRAQIEANLYPLNPVAS